MLFHTYQFTYIYIGGDDGDDGDDENNDDGDEEEKEKEEGVEEASKESGGPTGSGKTSLMDRLLGSVCAWIL